MKLSQFNNVLYKGNINLDFYFYCLKKNKKLIKYLFLNLWYYFLSFLFKNKSEIYIIRQFRYLKFVNNLDEEILMFYKTKKINNYFDFDYNLIVDKVPKIFIEKKFDVKVIGYELDKNFDVKLNKFNDDVSKIKKVKELYISNRFSLSSIECKNCFIVFNNRMKYLNKRYKINNKLLQFITLIALSILVTCFSFFFTNSYLNMDMFLSYFEIRLFLLNWLPIFMVMMLLFFITKRIHITWLFTTVPMLVWGIANQTKILYRDDVVTFEDLTLIREALIMAEECDVVIKSYTIMFLLIILLLFFVIKRNITQLSLNKFKRFLVVLGLTILMLFGYKEIYKNADIYNSVGNLDLINIWISTRQSQIRGLIYPFVYSLEDGFFKAPDGYDEQMAIETLEKYDYQNIPKDKKFNVIAIMLEAYNDFSKFKEIEFTEDIYKNFHDIQKESISGNLITNVFGGGTVNTERNFLTGYYNSSNFRKKTDSYVWYFKEQGYRTEAMHPIYGAFYNRASININLGFDVYYNYENKYSDIQTGFVGDDIFFESIIEGYEKSKKDNIPYFNFSVTYQNHVPYSSSDYAGKEFYFDNVGLDVVSYNLINEYFSGIKKTNIALKNLIDFFDSENEPVVIVLFGDHNPALGDNASIYRDLGINIALDNIEGFLNYYETPYIIHANETAKELFNNSFVGNGEEISPIFLMNVLFDNMGLKGNQYMQYMSDLKSKISVIHSVYYKEDNNYTKPEDSKYKDLLLDYEWINYYQLIKK